MFNVFENLSMGLFLSKILSTRESLESDEYYGAFISAIVPFNILVLPFVPLALMLRKSDSLIRLNKFLLVLIYLCLMSIIFAVFILVSFILIPFAYVKSIIFKTRAILKMKNSTH